MLAQQPVEDVRLHQRARITLENESFGGFGFAQAFFDELNDDFIRYKFAFFHLCGDFQAEFSLLGDFVFEHGAGVDVLQTVLPGKRLALRSTPRTRIPEEDDVEQLFAQLGVDDFPDRLGHRLDAARAVDLVVDPLVLVKLQHWQRFFLVLLEAIADDGLVVVAAA